MPRCKGATAKTAAGSAPGSPSPRLTRRNMRIRDRAQRQKEARRRGESTPPTILRPSSVESHSTNTFQRNCRAYREEMRKRPPVKLPTWSDLFPDPEPQPEPQHQEPEAQSHQHAPAQESNAAEEKEVNEMNTDNGEGAAMVATDAESSGSSVNPADPPADLVVGAVAATDAQASLYPPGPPAGPSWVGAVAVTDAQASPLPPKSPADEVGRSARQESPVAEIRAPRPARLESYGGPVRVWDMPWNQQPLPPQPPLPQVQSTNLASLFPPDFPRFHPVQNLNDVGAYLANASYVVSVGGPPLTDLKYGIVLVPVGDENLLFRQQPDDEASRRLDKFLRNPWHPDRPNLHDLDRDEEELLRHRYVPRGDDTESGASVHSTRFGRQTVENPVNGVDQAQDAQDAQDAQAEDVQALPPQTNGSVAGIEDDTGTAEAGSVTQDDNDDDDDGDYGARPAVKKKGKKQAAGARRTASKPKAAAASKPKGVVKKTPAPRKKTARAGTTAAQPTTRRNLRARGAKD